MICNYCQTTCNKNHYQYNIENVKVRYNPTYAHSQIFNSQQTSHHVRCTPTFHSTALVVDGYQPLTNQHLKKDKQKALNNNVVCKNNRTANKWYDSAKQELFQSLGNFKAKYSRERKLADLSSNPVFGGIVMQPYIQNHNQQQALKQQVEETHQEKIQKQAAESKGNPALQDKINNPIPQPDKKQQQIQYTFGKGNKSSQEVTKPKLTVAKPKIVSNKPTFTVIRNKKI